MPFTVTNSSDVVRTRSRRRRIPSGRPPVGRHGNRDRDPVHCLFSHEEATSDRLIVLVRRQHQRFSGKKGTCGGSARHGLYPPPHRPDRRPRSIPARRRITALGANRRSARRGLSRRTLTTRDPRTRHESSASSQQLDHPIRSPSALRLSVRSPRHMWGPRCPGRAGRDKRSAVVRSRTTMQWHRSRLARPGDALRVERAWPYLAGDIGSETPLPHLLFC